MDFDIEKSTMLIMKIRKREATERTELQNEEIIGKLGEKENYKYLGKLEAGTIKQAEMKEKIRKDYLRRIRRLLETKLCRRNHIKGINT